MIQEEFNFEDVGEDLDSKIYWETAEVCVFKKCCKKYKKKGKHCKKCPKI